MSTCYVPSTMPGLEGSTPAPKDGLQKLLFHRAGLCLGHSRTHIVKVLLCQSRSVSGHAHAVPGLPRHSSLGPRWQDCPSH